MNRIIVRKKKLPSFSIDIGELEALLDRLFVLFDDRPVSCSIDISLPSEKLVFKNIKELRENNNLLPDKITSFSIWLSEPGKSISVGDGYAFFSSEKGIRASSDSEAWCAGAIETAYSYLSTYKLWYSFFNSAPILWFLMLFINIPIISNIFLPKEMSYGTAVIAGWIGTIITIGFLYIFKGNLFPTSVLQINKKEGFIRRHSAELGLILGLLTLVVTIIGVLVAKYG